VKVTLRKIFILAIVALLVADSYGYTDNDNWIRVIDLERHWKFSIGDNRKWADPKFDDSSWESIEVPANWEDEGFNGYNGHAWYRIAFDGTDLKNKEGVYSLFLGYIDDVDEVFVNGKLVGSSGTFPPRYRSAYNALRNYYLPNEYINFQGKNVISVRVYDNEIAGGIVSGDIGIFTSRDDESLTINLRGSWDFSLQGKKYGWPSFSYDEKRTPRPDTQWEKVLVPGTWENSGYHNFDGTAWYRKQFMIPKTLEGEDLVLLLGKIDDFDQTYVNGKLVGATNRYDKLRIYHLSADIVNAGAMNLILIYVEDTGQRGGIYEGPVGIMKQSEFTRFMRWRNR
jgi:hypothetical protein